MGDNLKIEKIIFSSSERFSIFWNLQAKIWKKTFNIEPVCLLFGKKSNTDMSEEYGKVIEVPIMENWPLLIQITWSKFFWPTLEPDTTWMIGDMDMYPLAKDWWTTNIEDVPDEYYVHLDADGITQLSGTEFTWSNKEITKQNQQDRGHATNLPAHCHVGKGSTLKRGLDIGDSWENEIRYIVKNGSFNGTRAFRPEDPIDQSNLWCAEELRSTRAIRKNCHNKDIKFKGYFLSSGLRPGGQQIHKDNYIEDLGEYIHFDYDLLKNGYYKNLHCVRPFKEYYSEENCNRKWAATEKLLRISGMIE